MSYKYGLIVTGSLVALLYSGGPMLAQQEGDPEAGGPALTFGLRSTVSATDDYNLGGNAPEKATLFDSRLSFGYADRRANDAFSIDLNGVLRANDPTESSRILDDRNLRLEYDRASANSALSVGADYSLASVTSFDPFDENQFFEDDPLEESDLAEGQGTREQIGARFSLQTGLSAPLGFTLTGRYRERNFTDTTDQDLFDSQLVNVAATTRFTFSPVTETRVVLRYEDYTADDVPNTERQSSSVNLGLTQALSQTDILDVSLGYQQIETDETLPAGRQSDKQTGVIGSIDLTRELTRGTIGTSLAVREGVNGSTTTWVVRRATPLPLGALEISFGATRDVDDAIRPVGSLAFTRDMKRGTLTAALEQQLTTSSQLNELRTTRASLDYLYEINSVSNLFFKADFAAFDQAGGPTVNDTVRTDLQAIYSRELTRDWRFTAGYEYRWRDEENVGNDTSNRFFVSLEREFVVRP